MEVEVEVEAEVEVEVKVVWDEFPQFEASRSVTVKNEYERGRLGC
jgi:hypothetical protein